MQQKHKIMLLKEISNPQQHSNPFFFLLLLEKITAKEPGFLREVGGSNFKVKGEDLEREVAVEGGEMEKPRKESRRMMMIQ
ncbi:hypothetical protein SESBI_22629 [Sesbania bispinosa]|nr:hypothetical protein SESBI_22629 [Sesbania bispinosa]